MRAKCAPKPTLLLHPNIITKYQSEKKVTADPSDMYEGPQAMLVAVAYRSLGVAGSVFVAPIFPV